MIKLEGVSDVPKSKEIFWFSSFITRDFASVLEFEN